MSLICRLAFIVSLIILNERYKQTLFYLILPSLDNSFMVEMVFISINELLLFESFLILIYFLPLIVFYWVFYSIKFTLIRGLFQFEAWIIVKTLAKGACLLVVGFYLSCFIYQMAIMFLLSISNELHQFSPNLPDFIKRFAVTLCCVSVACYFCSLEFILLIVFSVFHSFAVALFTIIVISYINSVSIYGFASFNFNK